jgi:Alpha/beta hydrolase domain
MKTIVRMLMPALLVAAATTAQADVSRIEIKSTKDVLGGKAWGATGAYEELIGTAYFTIDPNNPRNKNIPDLDKAPRNAKGQVEFSSDIYIDRPKDAAKGNGVAFFEASNRGRRSLSTTFSQPFGPKQSEEEEQYGDGTLFKEGFTLVWVGWQHSVDHKPGMVAVNLPIAMDGGKPLTGKVNTFGIGAPWIILKNSPTLKMDPDTRRYTPVDMNSKDDVLQVATSAFDKPRVIPRDQWQFARMDGGKIVPDATSLYLKTGFVAGQRYDLIYTAKNSPVLGLGYAAIRDMASAVRYRKDMPVSAKYTYLYGASQTGRFVREFLYDGFNADEQGRKAYDVMWAQISGAARGDYVNPFSAQDGLGIFTGSMFPYSDVPQKDPVTGKTDGMLMHMSPSVVPKIIYTNSEVENTGGGRDAALMYTQLDGKTEIKLPDNVRVYMWASAQHGPAAFPPAKTTGQQKGNPNNYTVAMRAIFEGMDGWVRKGIQPPASLYPHLSDGTLVNHANLNFPAIPGVQSPSIIPGGYRADLGGPLDAPKLPFLVPAVDKDGNDTGGIRLPEIAVPLATYTGWNFRDPSTGSPTEIIPLQGSFIPFAKTKAERMKTGDPRLSIEERYPNRDAYLAKVKASADALVKGRYMLPQDVDLIVKHEGLVWDTLTAANTN